MDNSSTPAFPNITPEMCIQGGPGLSKREYMALHVDQPGVAEIITAAGYTSRDAFQMWSDPDTTIGTFPQWWAKLSNERRFELYAKVRVAMADALLAELAKDAP
jgi:hypothetical protein